MTNLDSIFKSRDITLPTKVCLVKAMVFPVAMYGCDSWTVKKAERWIIDAFKLWCWRRLLRVPWTARRSNQSILKERKSTLYIHWKDWCWSWCSDTLATCCKELTQWKYPDAGKDWEQEEKGATKDEMVGWHHPYGGKWRGTKKPLDESERGEWKSWLKAQHSENEDHGIQSNHLMGNKWGNSGNSGRLYFFGLQNHCRWWL